jgi:NADH dehydrogenase (ubiquinone) 1 alpha subcomplex subunit 9
MDFDDLDMIDRVVKNSNVVINLVGPRKHSKFLHQHEAANIKVASRIADAC